MRHISRQIRRITQARSAALGPHPCHEGCDTHERLASSFKYRAIVGITSRLNQGSINEHDILSRAPVRDLMTQAVGSTITWSVIKAFKVTRRNDYKELQLDP